MAEQTQFLKKVIERSPLETEVQAQTATNIVFRILRDMVSRETVENVGEELKTEDPMADMEINDLWKDTNSMVSFFSRLSPLQQIGFSPDIFMKRLKQEAALAESIDPQTVAQAVFSALKEELPSDRVQEITQSLPQDMRQIWSAA